MLVDTGDAWLTGIIHFQTGNILAITMFKQIWEPFVKYWNKTTSWKNVNSQILKFL